jgi:4-methylaminobutanoate oxidase (formaldehyde-forming)
MHAREVAVGWAPAIALRATYVGELGWEMHLPSEYVRDAYEKILAAGADLGIRDVGYRAIETLRLEKQFLAWAGDIKSDNNPYEAGLGFAVKASKPELLAGPALRQIKETGPRRRLCWFSTAAEVTMHGGELVEHPSSQTTASVRSAGYGHTVGRHIFSACLPSEIAKETDFEVEVANQRFPAIRHDGCLYDPDGIRIRG